MNDLSLVLICACITTLISCIFDFFYFSRRYKQLEEKYKLIVGHIPDIYILQEDVEMLKSETIHINGRISKIDKNIIYVEKGE